MLCGASQYLLDKRLLSEGLRPVPPRAPESSAHLTAVGSTEDGGWALLRGQGEASWVLVPGVHSEAQASAFTPLSPLSLERSSEPSLFSFALETRWLNGEIALVLVEATVGCTGQL